MECINGRVMRIAWAAVHNVHRVICPVLEVFSALNGYMVQIVQDYMVFLWPDRIISHRPVFILSKRGQVVAQSCVYSTICFRHSDCSQL